MMEHPQRKSLPPYHEMVLQFDDEWKVHGIEDPFLAHRVFHLLHLHQLHVVEVGSFKDQKLSLGDLTVRF